MKNTLRLTSVRPLVRYVDENQAVIETWFVTHARENPGEAQGDSPVTVLVDILGSDGFHDEGRWPLKLTGGVGLVRFEVVHPERWWPAGMGEQPLYDLTVSLFSGRKLIDRRSISLGLTSVRAAENDENDALPHLLINGQICSIQAVLMMDGTGERQLLPATGDSLVLVCDHYGPELLYDAADRAGVLLIQSVPIDADATPEISVAAEIDRLAGHPSLAGYFVGHLGRLSDKVASRLQTLDPTRAVFRHLPQFTAA